MGRVLRGSTLRPDFWCVPRRIGPGLFHEHQLASRTRCRQAMNMCRSIAKYRLSRILGTARENFVTGCSRKAWLPTCVVLSTYSTIDFKLDFAISARPASFQSARSPSNPKQIGSAIDFGLNNRGTWSGMERKKEKKDDLFLRSRGYCLSLPRRVGFGTPGSHVDVHSLVFFEERVFQ